MPQKESGFATLLAIAVIAIVLIIGTFFVFKSHLPSFSITNQVQLQVASNSASQSTGSTTFSSTLSTPEPSPTTKTYTDQQNGFTFLYPASNLKVLGDDEASYDKRHSTDFQTNFTQTWHYVPPTVVTAIVVTAPNIDVDASPFSVWIFDNPKNLSAAAWYNSYWYYPFIWGEYQPQKSADGPDQTASVSGQLANYKITTYETTTSKFVYVSRNQKMFLFKINDGAVGKVGSQILDAFKFTD